MDLPRRDEEWGGSGGDGRSEANRRSSSSAPGAFDIPPKNAPVARLRRWRLISLLIYDLGAPGGAALPTGGFGIGEEQLTTMMRDHNFSAIEEAGGVGNQIGYFVFLWESWQDLTLVILMIAAVLSLVLGIKTEVPADGILITGHSLAIDESSMTGESKIVRFAMLFISLHGSLVHKDQKAPILMSGCKVADGYGNMLVGVTAVGINTEWGLLMSSISEDTGEETPLQV
ncbi:hypothetical protein BHE74_00040133 [Ensete ventricosum]|nr:hypothetical protein BHE74_00040133 [Ensete ventricosum]